MPSGIYTRKPFTVKHKNRMGEAAKGEKNHFYKDGKTLCKAYCQDCGKALINNRSIYCRRCSNLGIRSGKWKGEKCITPLHRRIRALSEYMQWRSDVFQRDNWTCQTCNLHSGCGKAVILEAHHKKSFAEIIEENSITDVIQAQMCKELWDIDNGVTLCFDCHKLTFNDKQPIET